MQVAREQVDVFKDSVGTELGERNYDKVIEGFGVTVMLEKEEEELQSSFEKAQITSQANKSVLINIMIGRSEFRKGSISM